jgi:cobalt-zinc-cadmium efflux system outer membrane protein
MRGGRSLALATWCGLAAVGIAGDPLETPAGPTIPPTNAPAPANAIASTAETPAVVDAPRRYTLAAAEQLAEENHPLLAQALAEIEADRGAARQAGLYPNPEWMIGGDQLDGAGTEYVTTIRQEIITKGKRRLERSAAYLAVQRTEHGYQRARFDVLTGVRQRFYQALAAQRRVEILQRLVTIARESQKSAVRLQQAGEGTRADVLLLDVELGRAQGDLQMAEAERSAAYRRLAAAVGLPNLEVAVLEGDLAASAAERDFAPLLEQVYANHSKLQGDQVEISRANVMLRRAQVEPFPNFAIEAGEMYTIEHPDNMGILRFSLPIPLWNRNQGNIQSARAEVTRAVESVGVTRASLANELAEAVGQFEAALRLEKIFAQQIIPRAEEGLRIAQQGYAQGQFDFLRLLQTQKALIEAHLGHVGAQERRWQAAALIAGLVQAEQFP